MSAGLSERLRVGPAGWSYADWEGIVYPRPHPRGFHPLAHLAGFLDCVEINSSFYAHPRREHALRWRQLVDDRPRFRFLAKLGSAFTHGPRLDEATFESERDAFLRGLEPIADRLAALLVQFPLAFRDKPPSRRRLDRLRAGFGHLPLVLELRHRSWFEPGPLRWIEHGGFSLAAIDLPPSDDHPLADSPTPGPIGYLRLHGRNSTAWFDRNAGRDDKYDYLYGAPEIEELAERARRIARGSDQIFVVTNNHFAGKAVANAIDLLHALVGVRLPAPPSLVEHFPHLKPATRVTGQQSLFD